MAKKKDTKLMQNFLVTLWAIIASIVIPYSIQYQGDISQRHLENSIATVESQVSSLATTETQQSRAVATPAGASGKVLIPREKAGSLVISREGSVLAVELMKQMVN